MVCIATGESDPTKPSLLLNRKEIQVVAKRSHKKIRILYLQSSSDLYGSGYVILSLIKSLDRNRFTPIIILPMEGELCDEFRKAGVRVVIHDLSVLRREYFSPSGSIGFILKFLLSLPYLTLFCLRNRIDIIHTNTAAIWSGGVVAWLLRKPHIWQIMELVERPKIGAWLMGKMVGIFSTKVFCISDAVRKHFLKYNPKHTNKFATLYHGVDLNQYDVTKTSGSAIRSALHLDADTVLITFAGRFNSWKGYDVFVKAIPLILDTFSKDIKIHFLLLGSCWPGLEHFLEELKTQIKKIPNNERYITLKGFQENLPEWLAATDIFLLPSKRPEPNATVLIAAMAMKKPVIGTNIGGTPETILDGETGFLIPPDDPLALAEKIKLLYEDSNLRKIMGENGFERIKSKFTLQNYCEKIVNAYY